MNNAIELIEKWEMCKSIMKEKKVICTFTDKGFYIPFKGYIKDIDELYAALETEL